MSRLYPRSIAAKKNEERATYKQYQDALHAVLGVMERYALAGNTISLPNDTAQTTPQIFIQRQLMVQKPAVLIAASRIGKVACGRAKPTADLAMGIVKALAIWNEAYPEAKVDTARLKDAAIAISQRPGVLIG